jgi:hypothetical protein
MSRLLVSVFVAIVSHDDFPFLKNIIKIFQLLPYTGSSFQSTTSRIRKVERGEN